MLQGSRNEGRSPACRDESIRGSHGSEQCIAHTICCNHLRAWSLKAVFGSSSFEYSHSLINLDGYIAPNIYISTLLLLLVPSVSQASASRFMASMIQVPSDAEILLSSSSDISFILRYLWGPGALRPSSKPGRRRSVFSHFLIWGNSSIDDRPLYSG